MDDNAEDGVQATGRAKAHRVPTDGFLGRLTYTPAQGNEGIGQMRRNRAKDETPGFQQITPFTQWCAATKTTAPQPSDPRPSQVVRYQKNWLSEFLPEASINDADIESLVLDEIAASQARSQHASSATAALFSVGQMADLRKSESGKGHPVLAVASGVSGNILRLISLAREEGTWTDADIRVRLHGLDSQLAGEWCQDGVPISLIRFAVDSRRDDNLRWLLVQNGVSTTIYEPELRMMPISAGGALSRHSGRAAVSQIFANPLFTIPSERTGGSLQTDICFIRPLDADRPQLAIIDQAGHWSLWEVSGRLKTRPKKLAPVMKMFGSILSGCIPELPSRSTAELQPHKVLWLFLGEKSKTSKRSHRSAELEASHPRGSLLLCNSKNLHLFDVAAQQVHSLTHLVLANDTERILGVAPSRLNPAQAFVLTSTNLLWVIAKESKSKSKSKNQSKSKSKERESKSLSLDILGSYPHQKDANDPTIRLDVSPGAYINDLMACFVCVWSARETEMTVFWFIDPGPGTPVRYHRDTISLKSPSNFVGLSILPASRLTGGEPTSAAGRAMRSAQLRFFQLLTLGQDLAVHSVLCAWSDNPSVSIRPPDVVETLGEDGSRRLKLLQRLTDAFTVPDEFDERVVFGREAHNSLALQSISGGIQRRIDFDLVAQRLSGATGQPLGDQDGRISPMADIDFTFIEQAMERGEQDEYMPRHSLLELATPHQPGVDLLRLSREWDARQEALHRHADEWLFVPEARRPLIDFGPDDLVERLRELFSEPGPTKQVAVRQRREEVLQHMAAEMFLSSIGVSAVPKSWTAAESQLSSSLPFPSSPTLTSSQPSLPSSSKGKGKLTEEEPEEEKGDAVVLRLRKYANLKTSPTIHGEPALALSRWDLGADPDDITWKPGEDLEAEDAINRRRRKIEARRRKAERLSQRIFGEDSLLMDQSSQSLGGPSTQPLPTILPTGSNQSQQHQQGPPWNFSSQQHVMGFGTPRVRQGSPLRREYRRDSGMSLAGSSQQQQSQGTPSQPMSQALPGPFGRRPSFSPFKRSQSPLKKVKRKSELRLSGFR
ncbi:RNA polymerase I-specific transcription-initiation factor-domain-containing protein [Chaetomium strumarium]|uniref:RNA polymerase I-specific transcription-initiation factor-domain-containing protein n=1 Tax=Chaetomium strumarium TaxID=1170767 RepID=A0AAJ0M0B1_9PEZI|nr:RNA polymerase I-specific transcription-initiation factor-domain-containing protein [Chaetomium strumarium]